MAYLEIIRNGKLLRRQRVEDQRARDGFRVRLRGVETPMLKLGETTQAGDYELRVVNESIDGEPASSADAKPPVAPRLDGYELNQRLGEGGMGVVWKGIQKSTGRIVAVKFLSRRAFGSDRSRKRFEREVHLAARLEHPAIVRVYDSGLWRGAYFYTMELIDGVPLDIYVKQKELARDEIIRLFIRLCQAVQFAHERGVIHRDLKPGNVLISSDGQPHVLDFGLAKSLLEEPDEKEQHVTMSLEGEAAGTPAFMSPEQAAGRHTQTDERTDVWSIGVIFYRLLVGRPPHELSGSRYDVTRRIVEEPIRSPRQFGVHLGAELEGLLGKALANLPEDRYQSVGQLGEDLENFLTGRPLIARRATFVYRLRKSIGQHRKMFAYSTVAVAMTVAGAIVGSRFMRSRSQVVVNRVVDVIQVPQDTPPAATAETNPATVAALASQFAKTFADAKKLDLSDGVGEMQSEATALGFDAEQLLSHQSFAQAATHYQAAIKLCGEMMKLNDQRKANHSASTSQPAAPPDESEEDRTSAIAVMKPLLPFCGKYTTISNDLAGRNHQATPGTALLRMRLGGAAFTTEIVEPSTPKGWSFHEIIILYSVPMRTKITGWQDMRNIGSHNLAVFLSPNQLITRYGPREHEFDLNADQSCNMLLRNTAPPSTILLKTLATPGWPTYEGESPAQLSPENDPLQDSQITPPGPDSYEAQVGLVLLRLDFAVRTRDWQVASELLETLDSDYSYTNSYTTEKQVISAWRSIIAAGVMADGPDPVDALDRARRPTTTATASRPSY